MIDSSKTHVLIVGVSTRAMAESAARAGYRVTSLDAFGDLDQHPGVRALSIPRDFGAGFSAEAVVEAAATIESDSVAYLSPFENHPSAVERLAEDRVLWGNGAAVLRSARAPDGFAIETHASDRWLIKPRASGGGHGIRWWTPGDPVPASSYVQPFVDGEPGSIVFVAARGECVPLALTRQLVGDAAFGVTGFRYCGSIQAAVIPSRLTVVIPSGAPASAGTLARDPHRPDRGLMESATDLARGFTRDFDLVGLNCIDFIARDDVAVPIEINPRWSASMELVERSYRLSMFGIHATACTTGKLPSFDLARAESSGKTLGKAIVFARHDVTCGDTRAWLDDTTVRDVPHPGEHIPPGQPVCTVFATGADGDACYAALIARADLIYETLDSWSSVPA